MSELVVVLGPPAAGKSTWVKEQSQPGDITVDFDALAKALGSRDSHTHPESIISATFAARGGVVNKVLRDEDPTLDDVSVYVIHSTPRDEWVKEYQEAGARFVIVDPGEPIALMRAKFERRPPGTDQRIRDWYANYPQIEEAETVKSGPVQKKSPVGEIRSKVMPIQTKADDGEDLKEGEFVGYAAVFGNIDSYGDKIAQGAFSESLAEYAAKGRGVPAYWGHQMNDPMMNIGVTKAALEDNHGLRVHVKLDLDNPNGAQVHKLIKEGRVDQMSFAYEVEEAAWVDEAGEDGESFFELRKLKVFEVSVVQVGANQATELLAVKSRLDDQRALTSTSARAKLAKAADLIAEAMGEADTQDHTEGTTTTVEEPEAGGKDDQSSETEAKAKSRYGDPRYIRSLIAQKYI